jgi:hypothetical protein
MPRMRKRWPDEIYHSDATKSKIKNTMKKYVDEGSHNLVRMATCRHCNATMQENMIIRWHNDKCDILNYIWDYKSPRLNKPARR